MTFETLHYFLLRLTRITRQTTTVSIRWGHQVLSGTVLYGTAQFGGFSGEGTVFALNTDGSGFTNLYSFQNISTDGADPPAGVVLSANTPYGTTDQSAWDGTGTVFAVSTNGQDFYDAI